MSQRSGSSRVPIPRRTFLVASGVGFAGLSFGAPHQAKAAVEASPTTGKAKSTILFFLCGGSSHIDTWDMKPNAPLDYRGPFKAINTSAPEIQLCEHLPMLAKQAHHLAVVRSVGSSVNTNDHHAGYYYNLTGHEADPSFLALGNDRTPMPDDWPYMGSVVAAKRPPHAYLPNAITFPHMPSRKPYTRPGQFAAKLGIQHDPLYLNGSHDKPLKFEAPALTLQGDVSVDRLGARHELLRKFDSARQELEQYESVQTWNQQQQRAMSLLGSAKMSDAFNIAQESPQLRERYGETVNGMSLLLARRMVEQGVPFITVFWKGSGANSEQAKKCKSAGSWDTHGNNFNCLKDNLLPEFDRGFSALIEDLASRDLLDETLLLVTSEMGRKPKIGDPRSAGKSGAGRDHWTHCLSNLLVGGGIQGGQTYGTSDRLGEYPADHPLTPADIAKTVYHAMGINDLQATDGQGRPYDLLAEGEPLLELF